MAKSKKIILGVCGSIAAYKSCELIRSLRKKGFEISCILTAAGEKFITALTLQTLSGQQTYTDLFTPYAFSPEHISLAKKADLIVIAPATADIIARLAHGRANDLLSSVVLSTLTGTGTKTKVLICPAMNANMWSHPATQENVRQLKKYGYLFLGPEKGDLVCGEKGFGRLASIEKIVKKTTSLLS